MEALNKNSRRQSPKNLRLVTAAITKEALFKMSAVEKIKSAVTQLSPDEQAELFRWLVKSPVFKQGQLAALKRELAAGIADLENGRYHTYNEGNVMQLAEEVGRYGRERLKNQTKNS